MSRGTSAPLCFLALCLASTSFGQELLRLGQDGNGFLGAGDLAVLSSDEKRSDLPCYVEPLDSELEYDLNFRAGYNAEIPLAALAGDGNSLRVVFRITPLDSPGEQVYMQHRYVVPSIPADATGAVNLPGKFRLGPGKYKINWLMRDRVEKVCASNWEVAAETVEEFEKLASNPSASLVTAFSNEVFADEPPVMRPREALRHVKLIINFAPANAAMARLNSYDLSSVVSMVRAISREPQFGIFSVVAYQSQLEQVFFEQDRAPRIDFPALGDAFGNIQGGSVDIEKLQDKESSRRFIQELFETHLAKSEDEPDAIIFLGPKLVFDRSPETAIMPQQALTSAPIFYFIYNRNPRAYPWRDAISAGLNNHEIHEFNIFQAKAFGQALKDTLLLLDQQQPVLAAEPASSSH
ncbi:MAG: hypothetical protein O3A53_05815 [Acidobacteria bacterium]|nr:hypothetical protein [Acidobacteriota bacterium]MDA1234297.1 hypothetical protein [Acidobacteriota bacterium]